MKLLALAVAAAVIAMTAATIWLGARVREDPVVSHPYEEGLKLTAPAGAHAHEHGAAEARAPAPCDLGAGPCEGAAGGLVVGVELGPRPLAAMRELAVAVELRRGGAPVDGAAVRVSFAMQGMQMGENAVALAPAGAGRYRGKAILVRCPSGRRDWLATVVVTDGGTERRVELPLRLGSLGE